MLKNISIKNFKSFKNVSLEIPDFAVLVGYNGSGKTNLVNALHLVSLLASGNQVEEALSKLNLFSRELFYDPSEKKFEIEIGFVVEGATFNYSLSIEQTTDGVSDKYEIVEEKLTNGNNKPILLRSRKNIQLGVEEDSDLKETQLVSNQLALSIFESPRTILDTRKILSGIFVCDLSGNYLRKIGNTSGSKVIENTLVENLYSLKHSESQKYEDLIREAKRMIPELVSVEFESTKDRLLLNINENIEEGEDRKFTSFSASDGNLRTLSILYALFVDPKPSVIVIDEVENSFHPARIKSIMKALEYIATVNSQELQIILTTHSPVVLDYVKNRDIVYVYKKDGQTEIDNPTKNKKVNDLLDEVEGSDSSLGQLYADGILETIFSTK